MGACCCRRRATTHPPLSLLGLQMPDGVGRLDTWTCIDQVQRDVCAVFRDHIKGSGEKSNSLFEWVAGPQLKHWDDDRRRILAEHMAQYVLEKTEEKGGFVLGAMDHDLQLAAVVFVSLSKGGRGSKGCTLFDNSSHVMDPRTVPWRQFGNAKNGVRARSRALRDMLIQHDKDMVGNHIFLRVFAYTPKADDTHFNKLMGVVTEYADRRDLQVYVQTAELAEVRALEKHDFRLLEQVDFRARNDPEEVHNYRGFSTMTRVPRPRRQSV